MRLWPAPASPGESSSPLVAAAGIARQVEEGHLVALSAVRLSIKSGVILATIRDESPWDELVATELARQSIDDLIDEMTSNAERLLVNSERAAPTSVRALALRPRAERKRIERLIAEHERLAARSSTARGVAERLSETRHDTAKVRELVLRARDNILSELMLARLEPRA